MIQIKWNKSLVIVLLVFLSTCSSVTSQSFDPKMFGASYQVKPGEEMKYKITKFSYQFKDFSTQVQLSDNTNETFNIALGTIINFKILNKSIDKTGSTVIFSQMHIFNKKTGYTKDIVSNRSHYYFDYAFNRLGDFYSYLDYYYREINNQTVPKQTIILTNISENYIEIENTIYYNQTYIRKSVKQNWKTGWLESRDTTQFNNNGSLIYNIREDLINTTSTNNIFPFNTIIDIVFLSSVFGVFFLTVAIIFIYYSSNSKIDHTRPPFKEFLKNKFKIKQKKDENSGLKIDTSLALLEEILDELKNQE